MEKNFLSSITKNKHIKEIITELNLNEDQILSAYPYFMNIIDENKNIEKYEYITKIKIYDDKNVVAISVINNNANIEIKSKRLNWLYYLSNMNYNLRWDNPKESDENKFDENIFYWKNKKLKNFDRKKIALWTVSFTKKFLKKEYHQGIYIYGGFNTGKTIFLNSLANYAIKNNKSIIFLTSLDLLDFLLKNIEKNNELNYEVISKIKEVDLLLIDDLGQEKMNNWFLSIIYQILDYRFKNKKTCCFSSNFSINELKKQWFKIKDLEKIKVEKTINKICDLTQEINFDPK